ncbi:MAG: GNAT family N-acetyltransferase [Oligoflexia bacterium]|nr:GNAT family N-acetyltransferase [Oligoflexia bacterium]
MITIRKANVDDCPLILEFIKGLAEFEKLSHLVVTDVKTLEQSLFGERQAAEVVLAFLDQRPVGFAVFFHNFSTFLGRPGVYLEDLFVKPEQRGQGIGLELLKHIARIALERGCPRFEWAVLDWNEDAIRFYKRLGAEPQSEWTTYRLSGDALKKLAQS